MPASSPAPISVPYIKAIPASTLPATAPAPHECIRDAAPPVCSAGAGGTDTGASDGGETEVCSVDAPVDELPRVLANVDDADLCEEVECEDFPLSVVSAGGR
jgi:hypothetical protein